MNTIILNKRVMSPSNIVKNLVEGNVKLVEKAEKWFKAACRSVVGYKQIAAYLGVSVIVVSYLPSVVIPKPIVGNLQHSINSLHFELSRTNTLALHNVDRIVKNVYKIEKSNLSDEDKDTFRSLCIALRGDIKNVIANLPPGWYFTPTSELRGIIDGILVPTEEQEEELESPWYL